MKSCVKYALPQPARYDPALTLTRSTTDDWEFQRLSMMWTEAWGIASSKLITVWEPVYGIEEDEDQTREGRGLGRGTDPGRRYTEHSVRGNI